MQVQVVTLFPGMVGTIAEYGVVGRAVERKGRFGCFGLPHHAGLCDFRTGQYGSIDRSRNLRKAYEQYQNVLGKDAHHVDAHYNLAKFYQKVIKLRPEDADVYNNLGTV